MLAGASAVRGTHRHGEVSEITRWELIGLQGVPVLLLVCVKGKRLSDVCLFRTAHLAADCGTYLKRCVSVAHAKTRVHGVIYDNRRMRWTSNLVVSPVWKQCRVIPSAGGRFRKGSTRHSFVPEQSASV